jgi:hypothetical protein
MTIVALVLDAVIVYVSAMMTMVTEDVRRWGCKFVFIIFVDDKDQILSGAFRGRYFVSRHSFTNFFEWSYWQWRETHVD